MNSNNTDVNNSQLPGDLSAAQNPDNAQPAPVTPSPFGAGTDLPNVPGLAPVFGDTQTHELTQPTFPHQDNTMTPTPGILDPIRNQSPEPNILTNTEMASPTESGNAQGKPGLTKKMVTGVLVLVMLLGVGAGAFALRNQQTEKSFAWDCSRYTFNVSKDGVVTALNGSGRSETAQQVNVFVNNNQVGTFDVPALNSGEGATLGNVNVPNNGFNWSAVGTKDCEDKGSYAGQPEVAQCLNIKVYDTDWNLLTSSDLTLLTPGETIRLAVAGTTTSGMFEAARFTINGKIQAEVVSKKPGTEEFYQEYKIPTSTKSFSFKAELKHSSAGWF